VATADTKQLIEGAVTRFVADVPALAKLALVLRLELRSRSEVAVWRVEVPGPKVARDPAGDAKVTVAVGRPDFNVLAEKAHLPQWMDAYAKDRVRVSGDQNVLKLLARVIELRARRG